MNNLRRRALNCPVCGLGLHLEEIKELETYALVRRSCFRCGVIWELHHQDDRVVSIRQEIPMEKDYGFDYTCPHCSYSSSVFAVLYPVTGWKCINCGKIVPNEKIIPRGNFQLKDITRLIRGSTGRSRVRAPGYQRTPRTSRPIPEGAVPLAVVAQELNMEPKKLRSWLRKVGWRSSGEASSGWYFSPKEVEELKVQLRR